jgi:hypothetical protein
MALAHLERRYWVDEISRINGEINENEQRSGH